MTPTPSLLLVDDETELRELLADFFVREGFVIRHAANAVEARALIEQAPPDLALLDLWMPGETGLSLATWLRGRHPQVAIVMLTAAGDTTDRAIGLERGADDYIGKPFDLRELLARVRAVLRRTQALSVAARDEAAPTNGHHVSFGACTLDLRDRRLLNADGMELPLTAAEFDLLALFARHPNQPLDREKIMAQAHKREWDVFDRSIDLRIMRLRRKVEHNPDKPEVLKTIRNIGYMFVQD